MVVLKCLCKVLPGSGGSKHNGPSLPGLAHSSSLLSRKRPVFLLEETDAILNIVLNYMLCFPQYRSLTVTSAVFRFCRCAMMFLENSKWFDYIGLTLSLSLNGRSWRPKHLILTHWVCCAFIKVYM